MLESAIGTRSVAGGQKRATGADVKQRPGLSAAEPSGYTLNLSRNPDVSEIGGSRCPHH